METIVSSEWRSKQARIWGLASNWKTITALGRRPRKGVNQVTPFSHLILTISSLPAHTSALVGVTIGFLNIHHLDLLPDSLICWHHRCCKLQNSSWPLTFAELSVCTSLLSTLHKEPDCGLLPVYMLFTSHKDSTLVPTWACGCPVQGLHFLSSFVASGYVINCS